LLYGDHHVQEVRRILLAMPGVIEVYASSCFHVIEVGFDPVSVTVGQITLKLEQAGYLADLPELVESVTRTFQRKTVTGDQTRIAVGFQQEVSKDRPGAWPCPGMGLLTVAEDKHG
jgi:hypothetical protein